MQITQSDLKRAFTSSKLPQLGYTFEGAMCIHALVICLTRKAECLLKQQASPEKPIKTKSTHSRVKNYWYNNF